MSLPRLPTDAVAAAVDPPLPPVEAVAVEELPLPPAATVVSEDPSLPPVVAVAADVPSFPSVDAVAVEELLLEEELLLDAELCPEDDEEAEELLEAEALLPDPVADTAEEAVTPRSATVALAASPCSSLRPPSTSKSLPAAVPTSKPTIKMRHSLCRVLRAIRMLDPVLPNNYLTSPPQLTPSLLAAAFGMSTPAMSINRLLPDYGGASTFRTIVPTPIAAPSTLGQS